eukprot:1080040_1
MAGPEILASKRKALPSTCSPTRNPITASMETRPWASSASRYLLRVAGVAFSANPRGSKNPTGSRTPTIPSVEALRAEVALLAGIEVNAEAEVARARMAVNFMVIVILLL